MLAALADDESSAALIALAIDPCGLRGAVLRGRPGPFRDTWLEEFRRLIAAAETPTRVTPAMSLDRLVGGMDIVATLARGKPVFSTGILEAANQGNVVLAMAERLPATVVAVLSSVIDERALHIERDGLSRHCETEFCTLALDEGVEDEACDPALSDRLAFHVQTDRAPPEVSAGVSAATVRAARWRLPDVAIGADALRHCCEVSASFGITSHRADRFMLLCARAFAALAERSAVQDEDIQLAARLVVPSRARSLPSAAESEPEAPAPEALADDEQSPGQTADLSGDIAVEAVLASLPDGLLEQLANGRNAVRGANGGGRSGPATRSRLRGRSVGSDATRSLHGKRIDLLATMKAALPWQRIRERSESSQGVLSLRGADLRCHRFEDKRETTTLFVVDASGSQAARRLAEVKGAIELLLNDCYVRRDEIALIAFRRDSAELLLPPTRALARAKRELAALPGGGGTPLAAGLDAARELAATISRQGRHVAVVLLTDGRANVTRDGRQGSGIAEPDLDAAARAFRYGNVDTLLVDTSARPRPRARTLADKLSATYLPLPNAGSERISSAVRAGLS